MTCKDCIHYNLCKDEDGNTDFLGITDTKLCDNFKDKTKFIELPCKVGDTVYVINDSFKEDPIINILEIDSLHITSGKNKLGHKKPSFALARDKQMYFLNMRLPFENFGKTVFLTREEAEKALEERNK